MKVFAIRLKQARNETGMTQKEAADALNIPLKTYQKYEALAKSGHREPNQDMIVKIAILFKTSADVLLGLE